MKNAPRCRQTRHMLAYGLRLPFGLVRVVLARATALLGPAGRQAGGCWAWIRYGLLILLRKLEILAQYLPAHPLAPLNQCEPTVVDSVQLASAKIAVKGDESSPHVRSEVGISLWTLHKWNDCRANANNRHQQDESHQQEGCRARARLRVLHSFLLLHYGAKTLLLHYPNHHYHAILRLAIGHCAYFKVRVRLAVPEDPECLIHFLACYLLPLPNAQAVEHLSLAGLEKPLHDDRGNILSFPFRKTPRLQLPLLQKSNSPASSTKGAFTKAGIIVYNWTLHKGQERDESCSTDQQDKAHQQEGYRAGAFLLNCHSRISETLRPVSQPEQNGIPSMIGKPGARPGDGAQIGHSNAGTKLPIASTTRRIPPTSKVIPRPEERDSLIPQPSLAILLGFPRTSTQIASSKNGTPTPTAKSTNAVHSAVTKETATSSLGSNGNICPGLRPLGPRVIELPDVTKNAPKMAPTAAAPISQGPPMRFRFLGKHKIRKARASAASRPRPTPTFQFIRLSGVYPAAPHLDATEVEFDALRLLGSDHDVSSTFPRSKVIPRPEGRELGTVHSCLGGTARATSLLVKVSFLRKLIVPSPPQSEHW